MSRDVFGRRVVVWRPAAGKPLTAMDARCWHLGADLGGGCVVGQRLQCPFHHWQYDADGRCGVRADAVQACYAIQEREGFVFVAPGEAPAYPAPFFEGLSAEQLVAAPSFELLVDCPWFLVGANGFDVQHFRCAHDRVLSEEPTVRQVSPFARQITARFDVVGTSVRDRLTRMAAGPTVEMTVTDWCGAVVFVRARFARTVSYGMVSIRAIAPDRTAVHVTVFAERGRPCAGLDRLSARLKANFIRHFLEPDIQSLAGARFDRTRLVPADAEMAGYLDWLIVASKAGAS